MSSKIVILDNGASSVKCGTLTDQAREIPNAVIRSKGDKMTYIGHEFDRCRDYSSLHYRLSCEKGFVVDWDAQKAVWDGIFSDQVFGINTTEFSLILTEPYFNLPTIQEVYDQFVFEEYEFDSYFRCTPASLIPHGDLFSVPGLPTPECMLIVDSGFSFTHVVPILEGNVLWKAVKRLDVGGKLLTNHLKELVSYRQWNMMDETYIMNHVKQTSCYVSQDFRADLESCRVDPKKNPIIQEYVLPDLTKSKQGHVRQPDEIAVDGQQVLTMNNERFAVPELLFRPDDIGLDQLGLAGTIAHCISLLPDDLQGMFWSNIGLVGGNTLFSGFKERLQSELKSLAPVGAEVVIYASDNPITQAYNSAVNLASSPSFSSKVVTRAEYAESGSNASRRKFRSSDWKAQAVTTESASTVTTGTNAKARGKQRESASTSKPSRTRSRGTATAGTGSQKR